MISLGISASSCNLAENPSNICTMFHVPGGGRENSMWKKNESMLYCCALNQFIIEKIHNQNFDSEESVMPITRNVKCENHNSFCTS